VIYTKE